MQSWHQLTTSCCAEGTLRLDGEDSCSYEAIAEAIEDIPGVVAHGLVLADNVIAVVHTPEGAQILRKVLHQSPLPQGRFWLALHNGQRLSNQQYCHASYLQCSARTRGVICKSEMSSPVSSKDAAVAA